MTTLRSFVSNLDKVVQQSQVNMALKLAKGQCKDMEEYKREVGRMEGLTMAVQTARDMLGQMEAAEEDGELPEMSDIKPKRKAGGKK